MNAFVDFKPADMESVEELLHQDSRPVPPPLLEHRPSTLGTHDVKSTKACITSFSPIQSFMPAKPI